MGRLQKCIVMSIQLIFACGCFDYSGLLVAVLTAGCNQVRDLLIISCYSCRLATA